MKKMWSAILCIVMTVVLCIGCASSGNTAGTSENSGGGMKPLMEKS